MKAKILRSNPISIRTKRWAAYASAGAATALAGSNSAEAAIHYSGRLDKSFRPYRDTSQRFPLDQAGDSLFFEHVELTALAAFSITGIVSAAFRGFHRVYDSVSKLSFGQQISSGNFISPADPGILEVGDLDYYGEWRRAATGYVGFKFNNGAGIQYGWARVRMQGFFKNSFRVVDYAYADPGEPITAGQQPNDPQTPDKGSLGWLAVGAAGLVAWRRSRSRTNVTLTCRCLIREMESHKL